MRAGISGPFSISSRRSWRSPNTAVLILPMRPTLGFSLISPREVPCYSALFLEVPRCKGSRIAFGRLPESIFLNLSTCIWNDSTVLMCSCRGMRRCADDHFRYLPKALNCTGLEYSSDISAKQTNQFGFMRTYAPTRVAERYSVETP
ncbi:hypothetical protein OE88DRAFT_223733 [Heliocybe sulcata]|uniref:Uncharacterized protein n=1 Tax=Heliocybe sulcata TaxID=5364 RepID=A0A5C3NB80_9AGAM|nr:hypothetical protein OE88DRAFT_223733 [Heliocybe sulcata]